MEATVNKIIQFLEPLIEGTDMFIVSVQIKPGNNIKVFLDADEGLSILKIAKINKGLYAEIEAGELFPGGDFSLEVSSPGVEEPLVSQRQYKKNIGRTVLVTPLEGSEKTGILKEVTEDQIIIEEKIPKKKETLLTEIPFSNIKSTTVQIVF